MKVAVVGATGQTGQPLVQQALDAGHEVVALVRDATKLKITHEKLTVVVADLFSIDDLKTNLNDVEAVFSTLGFSPARGLT